MNGMSKSKRRQIILVGLATLGVLAGLWFGLINLQRQSLAALAESIDAAQAKLDTARKTLRGAQQLETELAAATAQLEELEEEMASGDHYAWLINRIRAFRQVHRVDIPQFSTIVEADTSLLPKFPYRQVTLTISGTAFFHDVGKFVADFENEFPHARIQNLEMEPAPPLAGADKEKLTFRMDIVMLVKPRTT